MSVHITVLLCFKLVRKCATKVVFLLVSCRELGRLPKEKFSIISHIGSVVVAHGLSSCGAGALECRLSSCGARA